METFLEDKGCYWDFPGYTGCDGFQTVGPPHSGGTLESMFGALVGCNNQPSSYTSNTGGHLFCFFSPTR